ncbi:hypothetical protein F4813DRAFT_393875 [Daldinia decipiens]|uniref:uncharacterized protein n=1 Tax=Daldinia decipiens TaxID=326647 RepID=UPI0020C42A69|nr:uncharacterized protein F4813DRAFT_393875 [Daldinia decipiens]KAI1653302.1 hypothetical protein F4813DRAFT_393875 [Daldinia decipiens]
MSSSFPFPIKPVPFMYLGDNDRNLPDLSDDEFCDLVAVLKALARSSYPRLEAVPLALNAYNCNQGTDDDGERPWAYFYPITMIPPARLDEKNDLLPNYPEIELDFEVCQDLKRRWRSIRYGGDDNNNNQSMEFSPPARYRFLCFIHKHRIDRKNTLQKGVHTISIWDREWDELIWHDTYHVDRISRRKDIREFWRHVKAPGFIDEVDSREHFMSRIRYRTVYHICEQIEETLRGPVPPRHTIYAVMSTALFHMNNARDLQVSIVPDRLELFGGQHKGLLPRFFAHLLCLCLDVRPGWSRARQKRFVLQFRILERLQWMRLRTREYLELHDSDRDGEYRVDAKKKDGGGRQWMYEALNIP